jgi:CHAT domain-containing protein
VGDERLTGKPVGAALRGPKPWEAMPRGACDARAGLARLPGTKLEAASIAALVTPSERLTALGFDANLALVRGGALKPYRFVHFATHGYVPPKHPELAGIVLSLFDAQGRSTEGVLGLYGLYNLELPAEMVVLSACETALGSEYAGEGVVGMARGFMYAGSRRVVASLWPVDDAATAALMKEFYRQILVGKQRPAAALRAAQLSLMRSKQWSAPYYWASFNLYGEWR